MSTNFYFPITIVGGGIIGAAVALGLAEAGCNVVLIEAESVDHAYSADLPLDLRLSSLNCHSIGLLKQFDIWPEILQARAMPYQCMEIWEADTKLIFNAGDLNLDALGYMVENQVLLFALYQKIKQLPNITCFCGSALKSMQRVSAGWQLILADGISLQSALVIGADGVFSKVREWAGICTSGWRYQQACLLISVEIQQQKAKTITTWQQFTPSGPLAYLPFCDNRAVLVWYDHATLINQRSYYSSEALEREITVHFPQRLGRVKVDRFRAFPLLRQHAHTYIGEGILLVGDAAHSVHPLAGQGLNLGYRDIAAVLQTVQQYGTNVWYHQTGLQFYQQQRRYDNWCMQSAIDLLYTLFSHPSSAAKLARTSGLWITNHMKLLKHHMLKYLLGLI